MTSGDEILTGTYFATIARKNQPKYTGEQCHYWAGKFTDIPFFINSEFAEFRLIFAENIRRMINANKARIVKNQGNNRIQVNVRRHYTITNIICPVNPESGN
ncbi:hypothetical protein [Enterobacillus tribolii]|uniref:hypothetical protein n=1 Tax=Enterobacillus tribolii TaxID=1487935 RepID=UPI0011C05829|nr:hypothetical protein [Enterobacillus tribolii]MBW7982233.1 hypothetical protein [Enterobacillus tribolii]